MKRFSLTAAVIRFIVCKESENVTPLMTHGNDGILGCESQCFTLIPVQSTSIVWDQVTREVN
jgi:hypothetical protein